MVMFWPPSTYEGRRRIGYSRVCAASKASSFVRTEKPFGLAMPSLSRSSSNLSRSSAISIESADDGDGAVITVSGVQDANWYAVCEPFVKIIDTIQAASVEQYDKLSQTVVIKNK